MAHKISSVPFNKLLLSPLRGWDSLHAASLCSDCPKAKRYAQSSSVKLRMYGQNISKP